MKVFKFGGASVKNAEAVKNVVNILKNYSNEQLVIVISAMGKTTNALELVVDALWTRNDAAFNAKIQELEAFHLAIMKDLFDSENHEVFTRVLAVFEQLRQRFEQSVPDNYNYEYDQVVSLGEVVSTIIVEAYLQEKGLSSQWMDARLLVRTSNKYRDADVDWKRTEELIQQRVLPVFKGENIVVTQGFIGHTPELMTTTLGREGSDFTAAIFAYCLNAKDVTIWKDVPGMLNADPKYFENTVKLDTISFHEAIELSYYGASVIHPKTIKPLQNKNIPLYVKSFINPLEKGTVIQSSTDFDHLVPSFIVKKEQLLISFRTKDFSFVVESHLSDIFNRLSELGVKINLMQNSALSFSIVIDEAKVAIEQLLNRFKDDYDVRYNTGLELVTIRQYDQETIQRVSGNKEMLLEQYDRQTARLVLK
jgi:aspartate kinase